MATRRREPQVTIIGAGLAGSEAAYQLVRRSIPVRIFEMRPAIPTGAHVSDEPAELVCSNSLGSNLPDRAAGLLKEELRTLNCFLLEVAYKYRVPAGNALAVDREAFSREVGRYLKGHALVDYRVEEATDLPETGLTVLATGPLTSAKLHENLARRFGEKHLFFFDAIAPIVNIETVDMTKAFRANRYGEADGATANAKGDYVNCPLTRSEYETFVRELLAAEKIPLTKLEHDEREKYFCACQPIDQIAKTGPESLRHGPLKPVGLIDPRTNQQPYAVLQLRQDNLVGTLYNLVGCQTNLKHGEQERVLRLIPALANAEFVRLGQFHRNTFLNSPKLLDHCLRFRDLQHCFVAGQICGAEGYTEAIGTGLLAGINCFRTLEGKEPISPPPHSMIGGILNYLTFTGHKHLNPVNATFGLWQDDFQQIHNADRRRKQLILRARQMFREFCDELRLAKIDGDVT